MAAPSEQCSLTRLHCASPWALGERLPNKRLKLTAPGVYGRIAFVIILDRRRSLGASR